MSESSPKQQLEDYLHQKREERLLLYRYKIEKMSNVAFGSLVMLVSISGAVFVWIKG